MASRRYLRRISTSSLRSVTSEPGPNLFKPVQ